MYLLRSEIHVWLIDRMFNPANWTSSGRIVSAWLPVDAKGNVIRNSPDVQKQVETLYVGQWFWTVYAGAMLGAITICGIVLAIAQTYLYFISLDGLSYFNQVFGDFFPKDMWVFYVGMGTPLAVFMFIWYNSVLSGFYLTRKQKVVYQMRQAAGPQGQDPVEYGDQAGVPHIPTNAVRLNFQPTKLSAGAMQQPSFRTVASPYASAAQFGQPMSYMAPNGMQVNPTASTAAMFASNMMQRQGAVPMMYAHQ